MKQIFCITVLVGLVYLPTVAPAQFVGPTGGTAVTTVKQLRGEVDPGASGGLLDFGMRIAKADEKKFTIEGQILERRGRNLYLFRDDTGRLGVEIRDSQFGGVKITPESRVRLTGEVDYEDGYLIMDIDSLELIK